MRTARGQFCAHAVHRVEFECMAARGRLKLKQTKEGLLKTLTRVVRDAAGEVIGNALEESPTVASPTSSRVSVLGASSTTHLLEVG